MLDVIIIGGGHAGCEAALAVARMGLKATLFTMNIDQIAAMSCNPAIGGLGKGTIVREIDALGGQMGKCIDATGIQFRALNSSRGPAVQGLRAQADRRLYQQEMRARLERQPGLSIRQASVERFIVEGEKVIGVVSDIGEKHFSKAVILCSGTFLNGLIHIGFNQFQAGRAGEFSSVGLSTYLKEIGFEVGRLKTGTCPRLDSSTIDFSKTIEQQGDEIPKVFSYFSDGIKQRQISCHITKTTEATQRVIEDNLDNSPLYTGVIEGVGPRYCPSIEDKVKRFPDKRSHQIFLEPEGLNTREIYPNGLSTSLPIDVQLKFLRTIVGLEHVEIMRPGYAIEYDYCQPTQLAPSLMTKSIEGLFFAGQINGTSGYEEAAAQGLVAGINSVKYIKGEEPEIFTRQNSYIGVMIDDLVTKGVDEPYRMFTSRAEFRLMIRSDNADLRLCDVGRRIGLLSQENYDKFSAKRERIANEMVKLSNIRVRQADVDEKEAIDRFGSKIPPDGTLLSDILRRPEMKVCDLPLYTAPPELAEDEMEQIEITFRYEGYIKREEKLIAKTLRSENKRIPDDFDYNSTPGLSIEVRERLMKVRPINLGQASRIIGVTPAALTVMHIYLEKLSKEKARR